MSSNDKTMSDLHKLRSGQTPDTIVRGGPAAGLPQPHGVPGQAQQNAQRSGFGQGGGFKPSQGGGQAGRQGKRPGNSRPPRPVLYRCDGSDHRPRPCPQGVICPPYHFVPIPTKEDGSVDAITDAPVWHNGDNPDRNELISGALRCTLRPLTPLLVGNDQYPITELKDVAEDKTRSVEEGQWKLPWKNSDGKPAYVEKDKHVLEPLRLDGRLVIPGSALKGMLRQSIGALLAAPMERVAERSYSFRPNVYEKWFGDGPRGRGRLRWFPAVVLDPCDKDGNAVVQLITGRLSFGNERPKENAPGPPGLASYYGGIDGDGYLHELAKKRGSGHKFRTKKGVLVDAGALGRKVKITPAVLHNYQKTIEHLGNSDHGHISERYPDSNLNEDQLSNEFGSLYGKVLRRNTLVYVEINQSDEVVTMGHNAYYRVAYADTVRKRWKGWKPDGEPHFDSRPILVPLPEEKIDPNSRAKHVPPARLSGARLLFGYVSGERDDAEGTRGIGKGDFTRLAGRLAFNIALEHGPDGWDPHDTTRFVNNHRDCVVQLKELGMPRPSAVEFYLNQYTIDKRNDAGTLVTYGDVPDQDEGGELNGRKFYLHQPLAAQDDSCFSESDISVTQLAGLARFILKPKTTEFRFTLRFKDLRPWELGAVLAALEPDRTAEMPGLSQEVQNYLKGLTATPSADTAFALKLGHGRPLGMGSVKVTVEQILRLDHETLELVPMDQDRTMPLHALGARLDHRRGKHLLQWLKVHQYRDRPPAVYPRRKDKKGEENIFTFHTDMRSQHAHCRRRDRGQGARKTPHRYTLQELR